MKFRPSPAQAFGHGAYLGGVSGAVATLFFMIASVVFGGATLQGALAFALPALAGLMILGCLLGGLCALLFDRESGADIDDSGIYAVPRDPAGDTSWQRVADLRTERRGGRTRVTVYVDTGRIVRLRAPYDGRLLASDPEFERKLFMLRNLWENHRTYARVDRRTPPEGVGVR